MENLNFLRPHDLYIYFSSNVSNLKLPSILFSIRHSRRGENDQQFAGIVVGKAWMRSNEGCLEFNPLLSQEQSNPRAKTLFHLDSLPLSPRTNRESETSKRWRNIELVHLRQRNVISIEQRSTRRKIPAISGKHLVWIPGQIRGNTWKRARFASVIIAVLVTARVSLSRPPSARPIGRTRRMSCHQDTR